MSHSKLVGFLVLLLSLIFLVSCGDGGGSSGGGTGTLSLSLADASTSEYRAVFMTIVAVQVHLGGNTSSPNNWQDIEMYDSPLTVNLLELVNGVREELGIADLPSGYYTQMRLITGDTPDDPNLPYANFVIDTSNPPETYELKVPSGSMSGEKIVGGFRINTNQTTELILDIDACRSVVKSVGSSDKWIIKPTIKVAYPDTYGIVTGAVNDSANQPLEGVMISAQSFDNDPSLDEKDRVNVQATTITDQDGNYELFVAPGTYYLVAYKDSYDKEFITGFVVESEEIYNEVPFQLTDLTDNEVGTVTGEIILPGANSEQFATLSFRQTVNGNGMIEIKAINVLNALNGSDPDYETNLPVGDYRVVASSIGYNTVSDNFTLTNSGIILSDLVFTGIVP
jgi:hypothetical protein